VRVVNRPFAACLAYLLGGAATTQEDLSLWLVFHMGKHGSLVSVLMHDDGLMEKVPYAERPVRYEYRLTEKGRAFWDVRCVGSRIARSICSTRRMRAMTGTTWRSASISTAGFSRCGIVS
jgi:DNA-binding PadR family transcriptional regulator